MSTIRFLLILTAALGLLGSCGAGPRLYSTWESRGERPPTPSRFAFAEPAGPGLPGSVPGASAVPRETMTAIPWAGTVSHHLLTAPIIDRWFSALAKERSVETFFVLCPSHWGLSVEPFSITDGDWLVAGGRVTSDRSKARELSKRLGVDMEPPVFDVEHGASTLMPFIARYFPRARVVVVAYRGEMPLDQSRAQALFEALSPAFDSAGRKRNFLVISTDFSHHCGEEETARRDAKSGAFFAAPEPSGWILACCDNRPGIYVLAHCLRSGDRAELLCHTNSLLLTGVGAADITSYFFSFIR